MFKEDYFSQARSFLFSSLRGEREGSGGKRDGFGSVFFLWNLLSLNGLLGLLYSLPLSMKHRQSLIGLLFYQLTYDGYMPSYPGQWVQENIIQFLCPRADLSAGSIKGLIAELGKSEFQMDFFEKYLAWVRENHPEEKNILAGVDITLGYNTRWLDELYLFAGKQDNSPEPFEMLVALQKKSGLPLFYVKAQKQFLGSEEVSQALQGCQKLGIDLMYATLLQYGWQLKDCEAFYQNGKPVIDYTARMEPSDSAVCRLLGKDVYKMHSEMEKLFYQDCYYETFCDFVYLEEPENSTEPGKDKAWFCFYKPARSDEEMEQLRKEMEEDPDVEEWDEFDYYDEELSMIDPFAIVSGKKRAPKSMLGRLNQPRAYKFVDSINHLFHENLTKTATEPGYFFVLFLACAIKRIMEMEMHKAGIRSRYFFSTLNRTGCQIQSSKVIVEKPDESTLRGFQAFGFTWPKEIAIKDHRLDFAFPKSKEAEGSNQDNKIEKEQE